MHGRINGQVSIEAVASVAVVLFLLVIIISQAAYRNDANDAVEQTYSDSATCSRLSGLINLMSHNSVDEAITIELDRNATIAGNTISVGAKHCSFYADSEDTTIVQGSVRIYDYNGVVYLENV